jgi:hypothetical protein
MMRQVVSVNWKYIGDAVPAFVTLVFMPFSYSIAYGLLAYVDEPDLPPSVTGLLTSAVAF